MNEIILESITKKSDEKGIHQIFTFELIMINDKDMPNKYIVAMYETAYKKGLLHGEFVRKWYFNILEEAIKRYRKDCKEIV